MRLRTRVVTLGLVLAFAAGLYVPAPAAAQGGQDNVTFWDDAGLAGSPDVPDPAGRVYLNPDGGRTPEDGLLATFNNYSMMVIRDRDWQLSDLSVSSSSLTFMLAADGNCFYDWDCLNNSDSSRGDIVVSGNVGSTSVLLDTGPTTWRAQIVRLNYGSSGTFTQTETYSYTPPSPYIDVEVDIEPPPGFSGPMQLYLTADVIADSNEAGRGYAGEFDGNQIVAHTNESGVVGFVASGRPFDSYIHGTYNCVFSYASIQECGNDAADWASSASGPDAWFGPGLIEPYPTPGRLDARSESESTDTYDSALGVHWDMTSNQTLRTSMLFISREAFDAMLNAPPATPEPEPAVCELTPDMAVSPQLIELAPGGTATLEVALRNLCADLPYQDADLLVSLSDGLTVRDGSTGLVDLGQRAAWQQLTLAPGETRRWTLTVSAADALPTAPLHITELYRSGRVAGRIDGVFVAPADAVEPAVVAPAAVEVPAPAPAPLPAVLPNTDGELATLPQALGGAVLLTAVAAWLLRRRQRNG